MTNTLRIISTAQEFARQDKDEDKPELSEDAHYERARDHVMMNPDEDWENRLTNNSRW